MVTLNTLKMLESFKPQSRLTFKEIKKLSRQNSNNAVQKTIKDFLKDNILNKEKAGNVIIYSLNLNSSLTLAYLNLLNEEKIKNFQPIINNLKTSLLKKTASFILLIFGSYAKKTQKDTSDIDIAVITENKKNLIPILESFKRRELKKIDYHMFTEEEFKEMLKEEQENLGKQIYKNSIICHGYITYINLIKNERPS
ncbi:MAG: nucleotidyltransferase domain-containing protein [Nanoarchaeota archaeon]